MEQCVENIQPVTRSSSATKNKIPVAGRGTGHLVGWDEEDSEKRRREAIRHAKGT